MVEVSRGGNSWSVQCGVSASSDLPLVVEMGRRRELKRSDESEKKSDKKRQRPKEIQKTNCMKMIIECSNNCINK
jgi:hypothetical protein